MDEALLQAFLETDYLVCLDAPEWACVRVDQLLPPSLQQKVGVRSWGFITAWNPLSKARAIEDNLVAQRELFVALQALPDALIFSAIGIGSSGWHEPSLFIIGADHPTLDALGMRFRQNAYVRGRGAQPARLRVLQA